MPINHLVKLRLQGEAGQGLIELLAAMVVLSIALMALMAGYDTAFLSLHKSAQKTIASTLANQQLELYNALSYTKVGLDATTLAGIETPGASYDATYVADKASLDNTANDADVTISNCGATPNCYPIQTAGRHRPPQLPPRDVRPRHHEHRRQQHQLDDPRGDGDRPRPQHDRISRDPPPDDRVRPRRRRLTGATGQPLQFVGAEGGEGTDVASVGVPVGKVVEGHLLQDARAAGDRDGVGDHRALVDRAAVEREVRADELTRLEGGAAGDVPQALVTSVLPVEFAQQPTTNVSTLQPPFEAHCAAFVGSFQDAGVQPPQPDGYPHTPPQIEVPPWIFMVPVKKSVPPPV